MTTLQLVIPGDPVAQGRPRASTGPGGKPRLRDPENAREWKGSARWQMKAALDGGDLPFPEGPLEVRILAVHRCPKSRHRKTMEVPRVWRDKTPDAENVAKAVLDAATGVLWHDDAQVARLVIAQVTGAQGEAPRVEVEVSELAEEVPS